MEIGTTGIQLQTLADSLLVGGIGPLAVTFHALVFVPFCIKKAIQKVTFW